MIARTWHGVTLASRSDEYLEYLRKTGVKGYRAIPGNRGVYALRRTEDGKAHFLLISLWDSMDAVRRFAGPDVERAVYYPEDKEFLMELEPGVLHYEVLANGRLLNPLQLLTQRPRDR